MALSVASRLAEIEARIAEAAARAGRPASDVRLIGASKLQPVEKLAAAHAAGLVRFGENRVQEGLAKAPELPPDVEWHLLGPLQSNKARAALKLFRVLHAIDRLSIARVLDAEAERAGVAVTGLLEVNLGGEATKHGFAPSGLVEEVAPLAELAHLRIEGLMAIPPPGDTAEAARPWFRQLRALRDRLAERAEWRSRRFRGELSMGMSDDFEVAVEEGATFVRVGTLLFGPR